MTNRTVVQTGLVSSALVLAGAMIAMGPRVSMDATNGTVVQGVRGIGTVAPSPQIKRDVAMNILFMREEEKLARDVYWTLGQMWGVNVFANITLAEQSHMDAVAVMIEQYGLVDPVVDDTVGEFVTQEFSDLYSLLVIMGSESLMDAYKVGAKIEELDIVDLRTALYGVTDPVLIDMYENLMRGSRNHLRAFARQIYNNGGTYVAEHLTQEEFDAIANSDMEPGGG